MRGSIQRRGRSYRARWTDEDGRERQSTHRTRGEAQRALNATLAALAAGTYVDARAGAERFDSYASTWLGQQQIRSSSHELYERQLRLYLDPVLGPMPLGRIRRSHVAQVVARCSGDLGLSASTTRGVLRTLRAVLDAAVSDRVVPSNVARDRSISVPRVDQERYVPLTTVQVGAIAAQIEDRYRALVVLMAASGLRPGEAFGLTLDRCIGLSETLADDGTVTELAARQGEGERGTITLRVDRQADNGRGFVTPKTKSSVRDVPVPASVTTALVEHVRTYGVEREHGLLFTVPSGRMITRARASEIWSRAVTGLDVRDGASWHSLRHYHASALLSAGVSIAYVAARLGHANASITLGLYSHAMPSDVDRVLAAAESLARGLA